MRHAIVSGKFYPADKNELEKQVAKFFSSLDVASTKLKEDKEIKAAIVPHAGYAFSGKCASFVYNLLRNGEFGSFIILGTNHSGLGSKISLSVEDFDSPLGLVESDIELIEKILIKAKKNNIEMEVSEDAHKYEHSIEVQLPFLQSVNKNFKIVPVLLRDLGIKEIEKFAKLISDVIKQEKKKIFVLASSDFTHYGKSYGFVPFRENIRENLYNLDDKAIQAILKLDADDFYVQSRKTTICGSQAISCLIFIAKNLKLTGEKLCYYTSGDVSDDWDMAVGYASVVFY